MTRRSLLKMFGLAPLAAVVARALPAEPAPSVQPALDVCLEKLEEGWPPRRFIELHYQIVKDRNGMDVMMIVTED